MCFSGSKAEVELSLVLSFQGPSTLHHSVYKPFPFFYCSSTASYYLKNVLQSNWSVEYDMRVGGLEIQEQ